MDERIKKLLDSGMSVVEASEYIHKQEEVAKKQKARRRRRIQAEKIFKQARKEGLL